ncbi:MAG: hypothetical protein OER86_13060, partial [Phycisphaerae bacterium]|nr:hypothetical protein [Phycisphaerae bacterium]
TVISKPIARPTFVVGKYLGVVAALAMSFWIWSLVFLLTVRHRVMETAAQHLDGPVLLFGGLALALALGISLWGNYFYNWVFTSRFIAILALALPVAYLGILLVNNQWGFQSITVEFAKNDAQLPQILLAMLMILEALAVICAIAIACSTRLGQVMTLVICVAVALVGLSSDFLFGRYVQQHPLAWIGYAAAPNIQYMWLADALTQKHPISGTYVGLVSGYALLYTSAVLCLATALFQTRETG